MSAPCFFASDLHGREHRYVSLLAAAERELPAAILLGGDLLPGLAAAGLADFVASFLLPSFARLRGRLGARAPRVLLIPGNDDPCSALPAFAAGEADGLWEILHGRTSMVGRHRVYGYACVPPTPFRLKDWERYDVSRFLDPGAVAPEEGLHTAPWEEHEVRYATIARDLETLVGSEDVREAAFLFHAPPYRSRLDRAALDGQSVDRAPLDPNVGSIAVRRFIERRQPLVTLHGHVHESARLTGAWRDAIGRTQCLSAAHDGPGLALVRVDLDAPERASRELLPAP